MVFTDYDSNVLFNSGTELTTLNGSVIAGFAINNTNDLLVINDGDGVLQFYNITWNGNTPVLTSNGTTYIADARTGTNAIHQMAFDWGGNLVCAGKNIGIYSMPTNDNQSTTPAMSSLTVTKASDFIYGDVNCDGKCNISDVTTLINHLLGGNPQPFSEAAADANVDGRISITDVTTIIDYLLHHTNQ